MRLILVVALLSLGCGRQEVRTKPEPPARPNPTVDPNNGIEPNNGDADCEGAYRAFRYDPERDCRYDWQTLCGLEEKSDVCLVARESAIEDATGNCWHFETCPPEGFTPSFDRCSSNDEKPFCPEIDIECDGLGRAQCDARPDCRSIYAQTRVDETLGCWTSQAEYLGCEPEDACEPGEPQAVRIDGECVVTDSCAESCSDCEPCPGLDDLPECNAWVADFALVRVVGDVITERIELVDDRPDPATCLDLEPTQVPDPVFLGAQGLSDAPPLEPQMTVLFPIPGGPDDCQIGGGSVTLGATGGQMGLKLRVGYFPAEVADCSDLHAMVRVRMEAEARGEYSAWIKAEDGCGNSIATESGNTTEWTNYVEE